MKLVFLAIILLTIAVILLGVRIFFVKGGKFPSQHVHDIEALRKKNIHCASNDNEIK